MDKAAAAAAAAAASREAILAASLLAISLKVQRLVIEYFNKCSKR